MSLDTNPNYLKALEYIENTDLGELEVGKHMIDGENLFVNIVDSNMKTPEEARLEVHDVYIDIQVPLSGEEIIGVVPSDELTEITKEYDPKGDAFLAKLPAAYTPVRMKPNSVCILFPEDGHAPCMDADKKDHVRKLIAKVRVV